MSHENGTNDVGTLDPGDAHAPLAVGTSVGPPRGPNGPALGPGVDGRGRLIVGHPDEAVPGCPHLPACRSYCPATHRPGEHGSVTCVHGFGCQRCGPNPRPEVEGFETEPTPGTAGPLKATRGTIRPACERCNSITGGGLRRDK
jgi:hypothetical protein